MHADGIPARASYAVNDLLHPASCLSMSKRHDGVYCRRFGSPWRWLGSEGASLSSGDHDERDVLRSAEAQSLVCTEGL